MQGGDTIKNRIKELRASLGLNQTDFGSRLGLKQSTVAGYENGFRVPGDAVIVSICREFGVSETWLRTGEGEMYLTIDKDQEIDYILGQIGGSTDDTIKRIIRAYWRLDEKEKAAIRKLIDGLTEQQQ